MVFSKHQLCSNRPTDLSPYHALTEWIVTLCRVAIGWPTESWAPQASSTDSVSTSLAWLNELVKPEPIFFLAASPNWYGLLLMAMTEWIGHSRTICCCPCSPSDLVFFCVLIELIWQLLWSVFCPCFALFLPESFILDHLNGFHYILGTWKTPSKIYLDKMLVLMVMLLFDHQNHKQWLKGPFSYRGLKNGTQEIKWGKEGTHQYIYCGTY